MSEDIFSLWIFKGIERNIIKEIIMQVPERTYKAGEIIILEWSESNGEWYIIKSWRVKVSINWQKIAELSKWDIFWEIALLNEEDRTATVEALEDLTVFVLTLDMLINMINNDDNSINKEIIRRIEENLMI